MQFLLPSLALLSLASAAQAATTTTSTATSPYTTSSAAVTNTAALKWYSSDPSSGTSGRNPPNGGYVCFKGAASQFPAMSTWVNYNTMWSVLTRDALQPIGDNSSEIQAISDGIQSVSKIAKVDPRVVLGVMVLESTGNVRAKCTYNGVNNCGLMQAYNSSSYDPQHYVQSIRLMIQDGTQGTKYGPGLVQLFNNAQLTGGNVYATLRAYNSGKVNNTNLSDGQGATPSYVSNMANYLQGWNGYGDGPTNCNFTV